MLAQPLELIAADAGHDGVAGCLEITVDHLRRERAHRQLRLADEAYHRLAAARDDDGRMELVRLARKGRRAALRPPRGSPACAADARRRTASGRRRAPPGRGACATRRAPWHAPGSWRSGRRRRPSLPAGRRRRARRCRRARPRRDPAAASSAKRVRLAEASTSGLSPSQRGWRSSGSLTMEFPILIGHKCRLAGVVPADDRRRRLLDGAARHVDHGPVMAREQPARAHQLVRHQVLVDIGGVVAGVQREEPVLADLHDSVGRGDEPNHQGLTTRCSCGGGSCPGTSGMLAVLMPRFAR